MVCRLAMLALLTATACGGAAVRPASTSRPTEPPRPERPHATAVPDPAWCDEPDPCYRHALAAPLRSAARARLLERACALGSPAACRDLRLRRALWCGY